MSREEDDFDSDSEPELLAEVTTETPEAPRKRRNSSLASSVTCKSVKRCGAIDRARKNVREALASFLGDSDIDDGESSNAEEETGSEEGSTRAKMPHQSSSTPSASVDSTERNQAFGRKSNEGTRTKTSTTTRHVSVLSQRRHGMLETTPPGRLSLNISPVTTAEDNDFEFGGGESSLQSPDDSVKSVLQNITSLLNTVVERMDRVESQLRQQNCHTPSSSSSEKSTRKKSPIPLTLRVSGILLSGNDYLTIFFLYVRLYSRRSERLTLCWLRTWRITLRGST